MRPGPAGGILRLRLRWWAWVGLAQAIFLTISSVIFLASPNSIMVRSM